MQTWTWQRQVGRRLCPWCAGQQCRVCLALLGALCWDRYFQELIQDPAVHQQPSNLCKKWPLSAIFFSCFCPPFTVFFSPKECWRELSSCHFGDRQQILWRGDLHYERERAALGRSPSSSARALLWLARWHCVSYQHSRPAPFSAESNYFFRRERSNLL